MEDNRADVQTIKERVDIVSVISRYLSLTKSGANYKGHCPFHKDDTPSFTVSSEKGLWHCFGCGEGGDVFAFLMKIERISFPEAAERLAAEAGVSLKRRGDGERERLHTLSAEVVAYFSENLTNATAGKKAREYLLHRGYGEKTWERFGLGYALPEWDDLKRSFSKRYGLKTLTDLGLLVKGKGRVYDRFRDRVLFPIFDLSGRPIAFGGRAFQEEPKYLNSPKTVLFDKGRHLYGLSWAREALTAKHSAILVEGYTDVLSLHLAGITHAVGSMGTALTQGQANLLSRFVNNVVIAYDRDAAGGTASLRGMRILRNSGLDVRVARLPEGDDPDSLLRRDGPERTLEILEAAIPFHLSYIESLKERYNLSTLAGKERALAEARPFYQGISSLPLKEEIVGLLAELLDLPLEGVREDLGKRQQRWRPTEEPREMEHSWGKEEVILSLLLRGEADFREVATLASPEDFSQHYRPIVEALATANDPFNLSLLMQHLDEESARRASYLALAPVRFNDTGKALQDALIKLVKLPAIDKELVRLREETKRCDKEGNLDRVDELQRTYSALVAKRTALVAQKHPRRGRDDKG